MDEPANPFEYHYGQALEILRKSRSSDHVRQYADSIGDPEYRDTTLQKIGLHLAGEGEFNEAFQLLNAIDLPLTRADAFFEIGRILAQQGATQGAKDAFAKAVESANAIENSTWECPAVLLQVGEELHKLGEESEGLQLLRNAVELAKQGGDFDSAKVIGGGAVLLADWSHPDEAAAAAESIWQPDLRARTLERLRKDPEAD
jgi:tetratricopeptide (TPR) repeat protein